jgi:predicted small integral membrane protein
MLDIFDYTLLEIVKVLLVLFVGVLFTQSGFDKVVDYKGNKGYIKSVFEKTFLNSLSPLLFLVITILEVAAGLLCFVGVIMILITGQEDFAIVGLELSALSILGLFTGQRIAKDYGGAASLVGYFLLICFGLFLFSSQG